MPCTTSYGLAISPAARVFTGPANSPAGSLTTRPRSASCVARFGRTRKSRPTGRAFRCRAPAWRHDHRHRRLDARWRCRAAAQLPSGENLTFGTSQTGRNPRKRRLVHGTIRCVRTTRCHQVRRIERQALGALRGDPTGPRRRWRAEYGQRSVFWQTCGENSAASLSPQPSRP
jgi:hypothetical protein